MYVPKQFARTDQASLVAFMRRHGFAMLYTAGTGGPTASHLPLLIEEEAGAVRISGHVARANEHWRAFDGETEALSVFWGPHAYISPSWYANPNLVPTWNYATVHAYGRPAVVEDEARCLAVLDSMVAEYEGQISGGWTLDALDGDLVRSMMKGIVFFEMTVDRLEGKAKMSQNRRPEDVLGAVAGLETRGGDENLAVAAEMKRHLSAG